MRFIVDESTGEAVVNYLRDAGHDVLVVAEAMPQADDLDILAIAASDERILLTNDKDFGDFVYRSGQPHRGIILFRLRDESSANRVRVARTLLEQYSNQLSDNYVVVTERKVRIRRGKP